MARLGTIDCVTMDWAKQPATRAASTFDHPTVAGRGTLYGPARQKVGTIEAHLVAADRPAANALQAALADLVAPEVVTIDPDGDGLTDTAIAGCRLLSCDSTARRVAGLPDDMQFLVVARLEVLLPLDWPTV